MTIQFLTILWKSLEVSLGSPEAYPEKDWGYAEAESHSKDQCSLIIDEPTQHFLFISLLFFFQDKPTWMHKLSPPPRPVLPPRGGGRDILLWHLHIHVKTRLQLPVSFLGSHSPCSFVFIWEMGLRTWLGGRVSWRHNGGGKTRGQRHYSLGIL